MWVDAGCAHRGENMPGSDFLTVFIPPDLSAAFAATVAPLGAAAASALAEPAAALVRLSVLLLDGSPDRAVVAPLLGAVLDRAGVTFAPNNAFAAADDPARRAAAILCDAGGAELSLLEIAASVGVSRWELSRL
jgi:hypothetical protein